MPTRSRIQPLSTDVMSVEEAARRSQLSDDTVRRGIKAGEFPGHKVQGRYVIPRAWYGKWLSGEWTPAPKQETEAA